MKRFNLYLPNVLYQRIRLASEHRGISIAELMRRIIEQWLQANDER